MQVNSLVKYLVKIPPNKPFKKSRAFQHVFCFLFCFVFFLIEFSCIQIMARLRAIHKDQNKRFSHILIFPGILIF